MNFFEHQNAAQRRSLQLVLLFAVAVLSVVFFTSLVIAGIVQYFFNSSIVSTEAYSPQSWHSLFSSPAFMWSALICFSVILLGSLFKSLQLGGNGIAVAMAMKGKHIHPANKEPQYQQLLNTVAEMAIASGNPVPKVFVVPGGAINAFAAGYNRHQTVIGVSEGAITQLTRDELQGVIAHEFSHINFGDVKVNMRLVALLHGILMIGLIGRMLLWGGHSSTSSTRSGKRDSSALGVGIALIVIGYVGTFFGNLIKSAVSRQREFLADASAVQFTRNPDGIAGALKKIAGITPSRQRSTQTETYSHFYFSNLNTQSLAPSFIRGLLSTHPPLDERIKRLGKWHSTESMTAQSAQEASGFTPNNTAGSTEKPDASEQVMGFSSGANIINSIGHPQPINLNIAKSQLNTLSSDLQSYTHDAFSARALIYAIIINETPKQHQATQLQYIATNENTKTRATVANLLPLIHGLNGADIYSLITLSERALQDQSTEQAEHFKKVSRELIKADKKLSLLEWCIYRIAISPLRQRKSRKSIQLSEAKASVSMLIYYIAAYSEKDQQQKVITDAEKQLGMQCDHPKSVSISELDKELDQLTSLRPLEKPLLLKAVLAAIKGDGKLTDDELTLIRMIALILDCPIPSMVQ